MSNKITTSTTPWHIWQRQCTAQRMNLVTLNLKKHAQHSYRLHVDGKIDSKTPPVKKQHSWQLLSSSLRCESATGHHTAEQYSKTARIKLQKDLMADPDTAYLQTMGIDRTAHYCQWANRFVHTTEVALGCTQCIVKSQCIHCIVKSQCMFRRRTWWLRLLATGN